MTQEINDSKVKKLLAQTQSLELLQKQRQQLNEMLIELKEDYALAGDPLKAEIELKAQEALSKLQIILEKLKQL